MLIGQRGLEIGQDLLPVLPLQHPGQPAQLVTDQGLLPPTLTLAFLPQNAQVQHLPAQSLDTRRDLPGLIELLRIQAHRGIAARERGQNLDRPGEGHERPGAGG